MKICKQCGHTKPLDEYHNRKGTSDGKFIYCKECVRTRNREKARENKEKRSAYNKQYYKENKEVHQARGLAWRESNREYLREKAKKYYQDNKEEHLARTREYKAQNKERVKECIRKSLQVRRAKIRSLPRSLTHQEWLDTLALFENRCAYCGQNDEMHQEHIIPVVKDGGYTKNNIIPACPSCNHSKNDKDLEEWYPEQEFFDEDRLNKILQIMEA